MVHAEARPDTLLIDHRGPPRFHVSVYGRWRCRPSLQRRTAMVEIRFRAHAAAPLATTWSVLADQSGMTAWTPARAVTIEQQGDPRPAGVGTIRVLSLAPLAIREQITGVDEPTRLTYRLLSGIPVRDYVGETILTGGDTATDILWTVNMTPRWPGTTLAVRRVVRALANGLAGQAERVAHAHHRPNA
jgi:hypothetical protein